LDEFTTSVENSIPIIPCCVIPVEEADSRFTELPALPSPLLSVLCMDNKSSAVPEESEGMKNQDILTNPGQ